MAMETILINKGEKKEMLNYTDEEKYELIPEGDYEVILENAEEKEARSGKAYLSCKFRIREDVDQGSKNRVIFDNVYKSKTSPSDYDNRKIERMLQTQGKKVENKEARYDFEDNDDLIQYLNGLYMRVTITNNPADEYHSEPYNEIKYLSYKKTNNPLQEGVAVSPKNVSLNVEDDSDLPF